MESLNILIKLGLALIIGSIIGLERESYDTDIEAKGKDESTHGVGVRTFSLLSLIGGIAGLLAGSFFPLFIFISVSVFALLVLYYILHSVQTRDIGITTESALLYSYLFGVIVAMEALPLQVTVALTVVVILILSRKRDIQNFVGGIARREINAFVGYALIALVIFPFLPNVSYTFDQIPFVKQIIEQTGSVWSSLGGAEFVNPFKLWTIVVIITGIDLLGYVLERFVGRRRGRLISSVMGGFVSSTATTVALAHESKNSDRVDGLVAAALLANFVSFIQIAAIIGFVNWDFLVKSTPTLIALMISSGLIGVYFLIHHETRNGLGSQVKKTDEEYPQDKILSIDLALKFAALFLTVRILTKVSLVAFGSRGFVLSSALAGFAGIDAAIINVSDLVGRVVTVETAVLALIVINAVNLLSKAFYSFVQGKREFANKFFISILFIIASSFVGLIFI